MAKNQYKIPTTLDVSYFDMEFNLQTKNGMGFKKPVSAKVLLFGLVAILGWFYVTFNTFITSGGLFTIAGFTIAWIILAFILGRADATGRMGFQLVFSMVNYLPRSRRRLRTRLSDEVNPLKNMFNLSHVDEEDGRLHFKDGYIGHVYHVVGSASSLMFEEDKYMILNAVDNFYRKMPVEVELIYDTIYEGHSVEDQIEAVQHDRENLNKKSKGLQRLLNEREDILRYAINNNRGLTSLHQYLVVRAKDTASLKEFENLLIGDVEGDGLMFRLANTLGYREVSRYLESVTSDV